MMFKKATEPNLGRVATFVRGLLIKVWRHKIACAILLFGIVLHFWYIFVNPTQNLYGGPGDHTAGLIWLYEQSPATPWWSHSDSSAYPFGEGLWSPAYIVGQVFYIMYWLCATLLHNGVAGYNLFTLILCAISYVVVYAVIRRIAHTGRGVAAISAYVAVFNPFLLSLNSVGHASYLLAPAWSMGILYATIKAAPLRGRPATRSKSTWLLVALLGLSWLWDPYFILFSWLVYIGVNVGMILLDRNMLGVILKRMLTVSLMASLLFIPLAIGAGLQIGSIKQSVLTVRSDIKADVDMYSMRLKDVLLPSANSPLVPAALRDYKKNTFHGNDPTFTTYIGISTVSVLVLFLFLVYTKKIKYTERQKKVAAISLATCVLLLLFAMPTRIHVFQLTIPTLTDLLTSVVSIWRVLARAYIFALPVYLLLFAIALQSILKLVAKRPVRIFVAILVFAIVCGDFLARSPTNIHYFWSIQKSIASSYQQVASDDSIKTLVEFPLREAPHYRGSLYFTAQLYHKKNLINATQVANLDRTTLRESLMDLDNPQTIPALKIMGADAIQVWQNSTQQWRKTDKLDLVVDTRYESRFGNNDYATLYKIKPDVSLDGGQYVTHLNIDSRMTNGEYLYSVKQTVPKNFTSEVTNICELKDAVMPLCATLPSYEHFVYSATLANSSAEVRHAEVRIGAQPGFVSYEIPPRGAVAISASISTGADQVRYSLDESDGVSIYGAYVQPIK